MNKFLITLCSFMLAFSAQAKFPVYAWDTLKPVINEDSLRADFQLWKSHGVVGVCMDGSYNLKNIAIAARIAHEVGLEYHSWMHCLKRAGLKHEWYAVNRLGKPADTHPAYVERYKVLDPANPEVRDDLTRNAIAQAKIKNVDYIQLDYIRYADVILPRGLWSKYNLVMDEEYAPADYCYCDRCVADFRSRTGIDIRTVADPSKCQEWLQFRYDRVTELVNHVARKVRKATGKKMSADVFPGPSLAKQLVRQEWNKWDMDMLFPMNYNSFYLEPATWVGNITTEEVQSVKFKHTPVSSGLFIPPISPEDLAVAVKGSIEAGAASIALFTPRYMTPEHWKALDEAIK
ncbi:MAG: hypothetical protein KBT09_10025 [Bacteroidales bacterium]|nr:hypothetical protein [Candidatus Sodaliphilus fimicaballi]